MSLAKAKGSMCVMRTYEGGGWGEGELEVCF